MPIAIRWHLWDVEITSPVVGKLGGLIPRVNPTVSTSTYVADDPIEEELRLSVAMDPASIHFCHHTSAKCRLGSVMSHCEVFEPRRSSMHEVDDEFLPIPSGGERLLFRVLEGLESGDRQELGWVWPCLQSSIPSGRDDQ